MSRKGCSSSDNGKSMGADKLLTYHVNQICAERNHQGKGNGILSPAPRERLGGLMKILLLPEAA